MTEGNITKVDNGSTATYTYDALNQRVKTVVGNTQTEFVFNGVPDDRSPSAGQNVNGQRVSEWNAVGHAQLKGAGGPDPWYVSSPQIEQVPQVPAPPRTGLGPWGGDLAFETWEAEGLNDEGACLFSPLRIFNFLTSGYGRRLPHLDAEGHNVQCDPRFQHV